MELGRSILRLFQRFFDSLELLLRSLMFCFHLVQFRFQRSDSLRFPSISLIIDGLRGGLLTCSLELRDEIGRSFDLRPQFDSFGGLILHLLRMLEFESGEGLLELDNFRGVSL